MKLALLLLTTFSSTLLAAPLPANYTSMVNNCLSTLHQMSFHNATHQAKRPAGTVIDELVLHDTASASGRKWKDAVAYMANPGDGRTVSIHYMVGKEAGQLAGFVPEANQAFHVKAGDHNRHAIGIELFRRQGENPFYTDWQYRTLSELVYDIMLRNKIPYSKVVAHGTLQDNRIDPENFDWTRLEDRLYELDDCASRYTNVLVM